MNGRGKNLAVFFAAIGSLVVMEVAGAFFHVSIVPPRWETSDLGMLAPIALCVAVGSRIADPIRRALFGAAQAVVLLHIYGNYFTRSLSLGSDAEVLREVCAVWVVWVVVYTALFAVITYLIRRQYRGRRVGRCAACGYDLRGLPEPRCPECGTPFAARDTRPLNPADTMAEGK